MTEGVLPAVEGTTAGGASGSARPGLLALAEQCYRNGVEDAGRWRGQP